MNKAAVSTLAVALAAAVLLWAIRTLGADTSYGTASVRSEHGDAAAQVDQLGGDLAGVPTNPAADLAGPTNPHGASGRSAELPRTDEATASALGDLLIGIAGTIAVFGEPNIDPRTLNGTLWASCWHGYEEHLVRVHVMDGQFLAHFEQAEGGQLQYLGGETMVPGPMEDLVFWVRRLEIESIGELLLTDQHGRITVDNRSPMPFGTENASVWVKRLPVTRLNVVDKMSGAALSDVRIVRLPTPPNGVTHPAGADVSPLDHGTDSPVTLTPSLNWRKIGVMEVLVGAPGYGWMSTILDLQVHEEQRIELERGATLKVTALGDVPAPAWIRLYRAGTGEGPASSLAIRSGSSVSWDDLAPGVYHVRLEKNSPNNPVGLGEEKVVLEAGDETEVTLTAQLPGVSEPAAVSGVLVVPTWGEREQLSARVDFRGRAVGRRKRVRLGESDFQPVPGLVGHYAFSLPPMPIGRYQFRIREPGWVVPFDLPAGGLTDLRIVVPEPTQIVVQYVQFGTGTPLPITSVTWRPMRSRSTPGSPISTTGIQEGIGRFRLAVPDGPIELQAMGDDLLRGSHRINPKDGEEFTLELLPNPRATFSLRHGGEHIPWPKSSRVMPQRIHGGMSAATTSKVSDGKVVILSNAPGRFRLLVPQVDGYTQHPPIVFDLVDGENTEVVIELEPE